MYSAAMRGIGNVRGFLGGILLASVASCAADSGPGESIGSVSNPASVGGCTCPSSGNCAALTFSDVPADGIFYITTFGGGADTQPMSCGGTADGTWAYVADSARFGCKAKLLIEAQGKSCVAEVGDCGPNRCVEQAACSCSCGDHFPIIDASPFITNYLLGTGSVGWSEKKSVTVTVVDPATPTGCPGGPVIPTDAGMGGAGGSAAGGAAGSAGQAGAAPTGGGGTGTGGAATGGAGTGGAATGGVGPDGGKKAEDASDSEGGCSCRLGSRPGPGAAWLAVLGLLGAARQRRREKITVSH